jgi:GT2 family glycosyltransferase
MKSTVIVPTYRRPHDLARCLHALNAGNAKIPTVIT